MPKTLNFLAFKPLANNSPSAVVRRKLIAKIDEQILLGSNKDYATSTHRGVIVYAQCERFDVCRCKPLTLETAGVECRLKAFKYLCLI